MGGDLLSLQIFRIGYGIDHIWTPLEAKGVKVSLPYDHRISKAGRAPDHFPKPPSIFGLFFRVSYSPPPFLLAALPWKLPHFHTILEYSPLVMNEKMGSESFI